MGLITVLLAAIFQDYAHNNTRNVRTFYTTLLRMFCCLTLFAAGMVFKTLAAKMLSSHFNKSSFFDKMQDALRKVTAPSNNLTHIAQIRLLPHWFLSLYTCTLKHLESESHICFWTAFQNY